MDRFSLVEGLHHSLRAAGTGVLNDPHRLLAYTSDLCDTDAPEFRVFEHNCTQAVLSPFARIASGPCGERELDDATSRSFLALRDRSVDQPAADCLSKSLRNALARYLSLPEVEVPFPTTASSGSVHGAASAYTNNSDFNAGSGSWTRDNRTATVVEQDVDWMGDRSAGSQGMGNSYYPAPQREAPVHPSYPPTSQPPRKSAITPLLLGLTVALIAALAVLTYTLVSRSATTNVSSEESASGSAETTDDADAADSSDKADSNSDDGNEAEEDKDTSDDAADTTENTSAEPEPEPEPEPTAAESFPRRWRGTYIGTSSYATSSDHHITRAVAFDFTSVSESGHLEGVCYVGADETGPGETYGTCYVNGDVNWDTGAITIQGTGWIDQGGLGDLRSYSGTVDFSAQTMSGTAWDLRTGDYETPWNVSAVEQISIVQNGNLVTIP